MSEDYKNGFRTAMLCVDSFWDNMDLYASGSYSPLTEIVNDEDIKGELKDAFKMWSDCYLKFVVGEGKNES